MSKCGSVTLIPSCDNLLSMKHLTSVAHMFQLQQFGKTK